MESRLEEFMDREEGAITMKWKLTEFGQRWEKTDLLNFLEKHSKEGGIPDVLVGRTFILPGTGVGAFWPFSKEEIRFTKTWNLVDSDPVVAVHWVGMEVAVLEMEPGEKVTEEPIIIKAVVTHYWNKEQDHTPYRWLLRTPDNDMELDRRDMFDSMVKHIGAKDGDEIEISIRKTGQRPFGDRKFIWVRPHEYEREKA